MGNVSPQQVNTNDAIVPGLWNTPINTIANEFNGNIDNSNIKSAAGIASSKIAFTSTPGLVVQVAQTVSTAVATGTTQIPIDDTIPQITEGTEFMTLSITPKAATNLLVIQVVAMVSTSIVTGAAGALFQDATANALAATTTTVPGNTYIVPLVLTHTMTAGTTSSTTFRFRGGPSSAATMTFNGTAAARVFGGITKSSIVITEIWV